MTKYNGEESGGVANQRGYQQYQRKA